MTLRERILADIAAERVRQDEKHGVQRLEDTVLARSNSFDVFDYYEIPKPVDAKFRCDDATKQGFVTWTHVLIEEVCEAVEAAYSRDCVWLRDELVQVAAVCVKWIEDLDTRP